MNHKSKTFRIFISSTFEDLIEERNALHHYVFPKIKEFCETRGVQFQPIDLRWGINSESDRNHRTLKICKVEIDRCQAISPNLNFLILLGSRYGWRPLPTEIPADHFNMIREELEREEAAFLEFWYRLDENAVPAEYCLTPRSGETLDDSVWTKVENQLRSIILKGIGGTPLSPQQKRHYFLSATEHEIIHGLENKTHPQKNVLCFFRTINGLSPQKNAERFIDLDENGDPDNDSQSSLHQLKSYLHNYPTASVHDYEANWTGNRLSPDYIDKLCDDFYHGLLQAIQTELSQLEKVEDLDLEIQQHTGYLETLDKTFTVHPDALKAIKEYTAAPNPKPFAVTGQNGCGKTFLLSQAIARLFENKSQAHIIYRFIGATPASCNIHSLLSGLCTEIRRNYNDDKDGQTTVPAQLDKLYKEFSAALTSAAQDKPIFLVLDALDQVSFGGSPNLSWLQTKLPEHVHIIVSCDKGSPLETQIRHIAAGNIIELQPIPRQQADQLLVKWLTESGRTLQPRQKEEILKKFVPSWFPSYLRLAFIEACKWRSFDPVKTLKPDDKGIIKESILQIADEHGEHLVSNSLAYIAASRNGLSEKEMLDLLSLSEKVIDEFTSNAYYPLIDKKLPWVVWSRLHYALKEYIIEREANRALVYNFFQKKIEQVVEELYFHDHNRKNTHHALARYFAAQPFQSLDVPNPRKTSELPYQQTMAELWEELHHTLTDFQFAIYKCASNQLSEWVEDYRSALVSLPTPTGDLNAWADFVRLSIHLMQRGTESWPSYKIFLQLAWEHAETSPLTIATEKWLDRGSCDWTWMRLKKYQRPSDIPVNPCIQVMEEHSCAVESLALAADDRILVSGSHDNTIRVWDLETRECLQVLEGHTLCVNSIAITPDARIIASAGREAVIRVWDCLTGDCIRVIPSPRLQDESFVDERKPGEVLSPIAGIKDHYGIMGKYKFDFNVIALDHEGKHLVSAGEDGILRLWEIETGQCTREFKGDDETVSTLLIANRKQWIISQGGKNTIRIWDLNTGKCLRVLEGHEDKVGDLALSQDEHRLVSVSGDKTLRLWNIENIDNTDKDLCIRAMTVPDPGYNDNVAISNDGKLALTGASWGDFNVRLWDLDTGENLKTFEGHTSPINDIAINSQNTRAITASGSMWSFQTGKSISDDTIRIWDLEANIPGQENQPIGHQTADNWLSNIAITADRSTIFSGDEEIIAWNHEGNHLYTIGGNGEDIKAMIVSPDGKQVITSDDNDTIQIWETVSGTCIRQLEGHESTVSCLAMSPDQTKLLAGDNNNDLRLWDIQSGEMLRLFKGHRSSVNAVIFTRDGKKAVSGTDNRMIYIWDVESGDMLHALKVHSRDVSDLALTADDSCFVSGSEDGAVAFWNLDTGEFQGAAFQLDIPFNIGDLYPVPGNIGTWLTVDAAGLHLKGDQPLTWCADSLNNPILAKHPVTFQRKGIFHVPRALDIIEGNRVLDVDELASFYTSSKNSCRPSIDVLSEQNLLLDKKEYAVALLKRGEIFRTLEKYQYAFYDYDCAIDVFRQLKEGEHENWTALDDSQLALAYTRRASIYIEDERVSAAIGDCNRGIQIFDDLAENGNPIDDSVLAETLHTRGDAYMQGDNPDGAIGDYKRALQYEKDLSRINMLKIGLALAKLERANIHTNEQLLKEAFGGFEDAFRLLDELSGTSVEGYDQALGLGYLFRGNYYAFQSLLRESIDDYNKCIRVLQPYLTSNTYPSSDTLIDAYANRGISYIKLEELAQSEADLREALKIIGDREHSKTGQLNFTLAKLLLVRGTDYLQPSRSERAFPDLLEATRLLEVLGENGDLEDEAVLAAAYYNTGCAYALDEKSDEAIDYFKKSIELEPDFIDNLKQEAELEHLKQSPQYIAWMEELEPSLPGDGEEMDNVTDESDGLEEQQSDDPEIIARLAAELEKILEPNYIHFLVYLSIIQSPLTVTTIATLMDSPLEDIQAAADACQSILSTDCPEPGSPPLTQLSHPALKELIRSGHEDQCTEASQLLSDICFDYHVLEQGELELYALRHAAVHLFETADYERLWLLADDREYRQLQVDSLKSYEPSFNTLKYAIRLYAQDRSPQAPSYTRLCRLLETAARLGETAQSGMLYSFQWAIARPMDDPRRIPDALAMTTHLDIKELLKTSLRLLAIEGQRQLENPPDMRDPETLRHIIDHFRENAPTVPPGLDWVSLVSYPSVFQLIERLHVLFPPLDLFPILRNISPSWLSLYSDDYLPGRIKQIIKDDHAYKAKATLVDLLVRLTRGAAAELKLKETIEVLSEAALLYTWIDRDDSAVELARQIVAEAEELTDIYDKERALLKIPAALFLAGREEQAYDLIERTQFSSFKADYFLHIAAALQRLKKKTGANDTIHKLLYQIKQADDSRSWQFAYAYKSAAAVLAELNQIPQALELVEKISPEEFPYKTGALFKIAKILHKTGEAQQSQDILERAVTIALESPLAEFEITKDSQEKLRNTYLADIAEFPAQTGDFPKAFGIASRIVGNNGDRYKYLALKSILVQFIIHDNAPEPAERVPLLQQGFHMAKEIGEKSYKTELFTLILLSAPPEDQLTTMVRAAMTGIKDPSLYESASREALNLLVKHCRYPLAFDMVKQIREPYWKYDALLKIAKSLQNAGHIDPPAKIEIADEIIRHIEQIPYHRDLVPVFQPLTAVLSPGIPGQSSLRYHQKLLALVNPIENLDEKINALLHLSPLFLRNPEPWVRALHASFPNGNKSPKPLPFHEAVEKRCQIAAVYFNSSEPQHAWTLFRRILVDIEGCPDESVKSTACEAILEILAPVGYFRRALDVFRLIFDIAVSLQDRDDTDDVVKALTTFLSNSPGLDAPGAYDFLARLVAEVQLMDSQYEKLSTLRRIAYYLRDASHLPDTMDIFGQLLKIARSHDDEDDMGEETAVIAGCIAGKGLFAQALEIASQIPDDEYKTTAILRIFAQSLKWPGTEKEKMFIDAVDVIAAIEDEIDKAKAVTSVLVAIEDDPDFPGVPEVFDKIFSLIENKYEEIEDPTGKTRGDELKGYREELDEIIAETRGIEDEEDDDDFDDHEDESEESDEESGESSLGSLYAGLSERLSGLRKLSQRLGKIHDVQQRMFGEPMDERVKGNIISELTTVVLKNEAIPNREELIERALKITREFDETAWRDNVAYKKASLFAEQGKFETAVWLAGDIKMEGYKAMALGNISRYLTLAGEHGEAKKTIKRAAAIAEKIKSVNTEPFVQVAAAWAQAGNISQALTAANQIDDEDSKTEALCDITGIFFQQEDNAIRFEAVTRAIRLTNELSDSAKTDVIEAVLKYIEQSGPIPGVYKIYLALIHAAGRMSYSDEKSDALQQLPGPIFRDVEEARLPWVIKAFILSAGEIDSDSARKKTMASIARELVNHPETPIDFDFISAPSFKNNARYTFIAALQEQALEKNNHAALRDTLPIYPFNPDITQKSMFSLLLLHIQSRNLDTAAEISKFHPQLAGLEIK